MWNFHCIRTSTWATWRWWFVKQRSEVSAEFPSINFSHEVTFVTVNSAKWRGFDDKDLSSAQFAGMEVELWCSFVSSSLYPSPVPPTFSPPFTVCSASTGLWDSVFCGSGSREKEGCHQYQRNPVAKGEFSASSSCFYNNISSDPSKH